MGNIFSSSEKSHIICMKCNNKKHIRNDNLEIIHMERHLYDYHYRYEQHYRYEPESKCEYNTITFRCSEGHIFKYYGELKHINYVIKYNEKYWKDKSLVEQLKKENAELKQKCYPFTVKK